MARDAESDSGNSEGNSQSAGALFYLKSLARLNKLPNDMGDLEGIASGGTMGKKEGSREFVSALFGDKVKAQKAIVKQLLNEIALRESIRERALSQIEADILQCENFLLEISSMTDGTNNLPEESIRFGTRRTSLETKLWDLESAKRAEEVESWRDLANLRRYLLFALKDYWAAARRTSLLSLENDENTAG